MLSDSELKEMAESIRKQGLLNPCVRQGDTLLDGRNRIEACKMAGVEPRFIEYSGDSPVAFIVAVNIKRRQLQPSQAAAIAVELLPALRKEAEAVLPLKRSIAAKQGAGGQLFVELHTANEAFSTVRRAEDGFGGLDPSEVESIERDCRRGGQKAKVQIALLQKKTDTLAESANQTGASRRMVAEAKAIKEADPERFEKIKAGKLSIAMAKREIAAQQEQKEMEQRPQSQSRRIKRSPYSKCATCATVHAPHCSLPVSSQMPSLPTRRILNNSCRCLVNWRRRAKVFRSWR